MVFNYDFYRAFKGRKRPKAKSFCSWRVLTGLVVACFLFRATVRPTGRSQQSTRRLLQEQVPPLLITPPETPCHVLVISTYPPRKCGIAQFTQLFLNATRKIQDHMLPESRCQFSVLALDDDDDTTGYDSEFVIGKIVKDTVQPGMSFWNASRWILEHQESTSQRLSKLRKEGVSTEGLPKSDLPFTHLLTELEFGIVWHKWQLLDLVRWVVAGQRQLALAIGDIQSVLVCHSPFAYPHIEEKGFVRHLVDHSSAIVAMSWHGYHSLITAYGVPEFKVVFIPHGVDLPPAPQSARSLKPAPSLSENEHHDLRTLEHLMSLPKGHKDRPILILSHGLIHKNKGYHRLVRNLREIVDGAKGRQKVALLIMGMEHTLNVEQYIMPDLLNNATALGVREFMTWHSEYSSQADISKWLGLSDVYASLYEEIAPTSGALLQAMAHGCAIVATSYRFATEVLTADRGLVVPFEDDAQIQSAFLSLVNSPKLRARFGRNAAAFARHWTWAAVASQYRQLFAITQEESHEWERHRSRSPYFIPPGEKLKALRPLTPDPYAENYHLDRELYRGEGVKRPQEFEAVWSGDRITAFHGVELFLGGEIPEDQQLKPGVYGIYADRETEVNGVITRTGSYALSTVTITWPGGRIAVDSEGHVDGSGWQQSDVVDGLRVKGVKEYQNGVTLFRRAWKRRRLAATSEAASDGLVVAEKSELGREVNQGLSGLAETAGTQVFEWLSNRASLFSPRRTTGDARLGNSARDGVLGRSGGELTGLDSTPHSETGPLRIRRLADIEEDLPVRFSARGENDRALYHEVTVRTGQVTVVVTVKLGEEVTVTLVDASRFDHPHGLLGQTLRCAWDLPARTTGHCPATFRKELFIGADVASLNPDVWRVKDSDNMDDLEKHLYRAAIPGQEWEIWGVYFNEVEAHQHWLKGAEFNYEPR